MTLYENSEVAKTPVKNGNGIENKRDSIILPAKFQEKRPLLSPLSCHFWKLL